MGAESSAQRDGKSQEDASASASASASPGEQRSEVKLLQEEGSILDDKPLQKNGQISSMTSLNGLSEDNTLAEVGQPDGVSVAEKEEAPETADTIQDEVAPQVNGEKMEKESPDSNDISAVEEKTVEQKPDDASEVGFKKIFRFVGFKFTLKKDKSEEKDPVKLLTVKDKEEEEVSATDDPEKKQEEAASVEEKSTVEEKEADTEGSKTEVEVTKDETADASPEGAADKATDEAVKEEGADKEGESSPPPQETALSPFRKLFSTGLFSNLRKKTSMKKTKEEEDKEPAVEGETAKKEETKTVDEKEEKVEVDEETKEEAPQTPKEETSEAKEEAAAALGEDKSEPTEEGPATPGEEKSEPKEEVPAASEEVKSEATPDPEVSAETSAPTSTATDEAKQEKEKAENGGEEEKAVVVEVTSEAELLSSQDKAKPLGSPLKKLFTGAGLKKLSTKKQKNKKDTETKMAESGEQPSEQLQSSTESTEAPKTDSGPSSPEESGEHVIAVEVTQNESSQEAEGEVGSDGEKKKEGIIAWSSFKKLVTPKKRVKRSSESEDEATGDKPAKSATLSSSESAALADKSVEEDAKEEKPTEEEPKTENTEKLVSSTEEPKKKMDTSVSWEALMCMGGPKKRTRRTSDSDDDETKIEEEASSAAAAATGEGEQEGKTEAAASQNAESEGEVVTTAEPLSSPLEKESAWDTLKRIVMPKTRSKSEEKPEESADQVQSDSEAPKEESSFSLRKFFPGRRKKKVEKQASTEMGSGEEDSDTPAVVPLSEYDEQSEAEQEVPATPAAVQSKVSAEDRSPSWIPATVDDADDKQLSDIPEEAENAATPKSVDTDIAEDETEDQAALSPKAPGNTGRRLSTAEVKPLAPAPAAETTPVPQGPKSETAEEVVEAIEPQISEAPLQTSVTVEDVPVEVASEKVEDEPTREKAESKTNAILEAHVCDEATAICTDLSTHEIADVAVEKPVEPIVECVAVIHKAVSTEVSTEEKPASTENASVTEHAVLKAQVNQVETTVLETAAENTLSNVADIQVATESCEPQSEKVGVVTAVLEESEFVQLTTMSENSPKAALVSPITPTSEAVVCSQSPEVTEPTIETKEVKMDMKQLSAKEENIPVKEVVSSVTEVISSTTCETTKTIITKETESAMPLVVPSEEAPVITETVVIVASDVVVMESASVSEPVDDEAVEEAATIHTTKVEIVAVIEQASEKTEEMENDVQQGSELEIQSMVIAQAAVQDAMDKISEDASEPEKPTTSSTTIAVQAMATTEKEIEIPTETPVVTETPVTVFCEKPAPKSPQPLHVATEVIDTIPLELTESLDAAVKEEKKKAEKELKQAVEVKVSEETVAVEEVVEIKAESETGEVELSKVDSEDVQEPDAKEEKPQAVEETEQKAPSEDKKVKVTEIHMPIQVVLETAQEVEEASVEEEVAVEFDSNGPVAQDAGVKAESPASSEGTQTTVLAEVPSQVTEAAGSQAEAEKSQSGKCAEVMAQVIEVIEEAVKEIEPVSTEITAAS